jgi:hypothetical protein
MIPPNVVRMIGEIDDGLAYLESARMEHFINADRYYGSRRRTKYLGFERLVSCELYCRLKHKLGNIVFAEFPGTSKDRIDLWVNVGSCPIYLELKMYYSDTRNPYEKDFLKLRRMVDAETSAVAVQVHFHFYQNRRQTTHNTLRNLAAGLPSDEYWYDIAIVHDRQLKHFVRLAFGRR